LEKKGDKYLVLPEIFFAPLFILLDYILWGGTKNKNWGIFGYPIKFKFSEKMDSFLEELEFTAYRQKYSIF